MVVRRIAVPMGSIATQSPNDLRAIAALKTACKTHDEVDWFWWNDVVGLNEADAIVTLDEDRHSCKKLDLSRFQIPSEGYVKIEPLPSGSIPIVGGKTSQLVQIQHKSGRTFAFQPYHFAQ